MTQVFTKVGPQGHMLAKAHATDAAYDLRAAESFTLYDNETKAIPTDLYLAIPRGHHGLVLSRSGLAAKQGIFVLNAPGLIDSGYRGEVKVILHKVAMEGTDYKIHHAAGDRIAQLLFSSSDLWPSYTDSDIWDSKFGNSDRGVGGLGSTGVS
jgi:dUTP pyrophosphatase